MDGQKRAFPYHSAVQSIEVKRRAVEGLNPGQETTHAKVFAQPDLTAEETSASTDFTTWTDAQIKEFLEMRGEDYDDCQTRQQLVQCAKECEQTTGPAAPPQAKQQEDEEDPLDAFMAEINQAAKEESQNPKSKPKAEREDEADNVADFMEAREKRGGAGVFVAEGYNSDEEVYATERALQQQGDDEETEGRQQIGLLAPPDHDAINYEPFAKDFYTPVPKIASMNPGQVQAMRRQLGIRVSGFDAPGPVEAFAQCRLDAALMAVIRKAGYEKPTAIQAQALPAALSGRDILGIAKTGSGKTAAFIIPMVVHIQDQPELGKGEGPIGVVIAPTRELAEQIHKEARRFAKPYGMRIAAGIGGLSKFEQFKDLKAGSDAAVCTPGRLIDLIKMKGCTLRKTTYIVFDEADRMFDMGFEPQVRSIIGQIRPDRQTLLFSATMPNKVERLVRDAQTSPVRITIGEVGAANEDIKQVVDIVDEQKKLDWLLSRLQTMVDEGEVLVFANQIVRVEELTEKIRAAGQRVVAIHGDMDQHTRAQALKDFSAGKQHVLVATDVAARGLDIKSIKTVVNFDAAKDIDTHVHRVGRTGRAGDKDGTAYTLLTPKQSHFAGLLVNSMVAANQEISPALQSLALKDNRFRKGHTRYKAGGKFSASGAQRRQQVGGAGIGFGPERDDPIMDLYSDRAEYAKGKGLPPAPEPLASPELPPPAPPMSVAEHSYPNAVLSHGQPALAASQPAPQLQAPAPVRAPEPPQSRPEPTAGGVFGGQGLKGIMQNRFRSQFVASGSTGGDIGQRATIIAPKKSQQPAEATPVPSFLAKKMNAQSSSGQAQQALAAARQIAARLASGGAAETSVLQPSHPPPMGRQQTPAGFGSSASAYPDLSSNRSRNSPESGSRKAYGRRDSDGDHPRHQPQHGGHRREGPSQLGSSASNYPDLSRDRQHGGRGSGFSGGPSPSENPYERYATNHAQPPQPSGYVQPSMQPSHSSASTPYGNLYAGRSSGHTATPPGSYATPGGPPPQPGSVQASIAAAQAIAARLSAQAAAQPPLPPGPPPASRQGGMAVDDSVQASIQAAKAIAARFADKGGGGSVLGSQQSANSGQWAWGKG